MIILLLKNLSWESKNSTNAKKIDNCVYDFGGFVEKGVLSIVKESNVVIIPCTSNYNSLLRTLETLNEIGNDDRVCILVTDYRDEKEKNKFVKLLKVILQI